MKTKTNYVKKYLINNFRRASYIYRNHYIEGPARNASNFQTNMAIYLDTKNMSASEFAKRCTAFGDAHPSWKRVQVTSGDMYSYLSGRCVPKAEKLELISRFTNITEQMWAGYQSKIITPVTVEDMDNAA